MLVDIWYDVLRIFSPEKCEFLIFAPYTQKWGPLFDMAGTTADHQRTQVDDSFKCPAARVPGNSCAVFAFAFPPRQLTCYSTHFRPKRVVVTYFLAMSAWVTISYLP